MFSSVDRVVRDILSSIGDSKADGYVMCRRQVSRSLADLGTIVFNESQCAAVEVGDDFTIPMPPDCSVPLRLWKDTELGPRPLGRLQPLSSDPIDCDCEPQEDCSSILQPEAGASTADAGQALSSGIRVDGYFDYFCQSFRSNTDVFENGKWREDPANNRISLTSGYYVFPGSKLTLLYRTFTDKDAEFLIPDTWYEALRCHVLWNVYQTKDPNKAEMFRRTMRMHIDNAKQNKMAEWSSRDLIGALKSNNNVA